MILTETIHLFPLVELDYPDTIWDFSWSLWWPGNYGKIIPHDAFMFVCKRPYFGWFTIVLEERKQ